MSYELRTIWHGDELSSLRCLGPRAYEKALLGILRIRAKTGKTHVDWTLHLIDKFLNESEKSSNCISHESIAHAMVEASPDDLKAIMYSIDVESSLELRELLALGWRNVGNEFRDDETVVKEAGKN